MKTNPDGEKTDISINGRTQVCGIIGDPVEHSLSPAMHNSAFRLLGLDFIYLPFRVKRENLEQAVEGMRALNMRGLNVTLPHKIAIMPLLDEIDSSAGKIGAVNTVMNDDGKLKGYNTDAAGFWQSLAAAKVSIENKNVLVLGAGGASRSITCMLVDRGANVTILNRHSGTARELADWVFSLFRREIDVSELSPGMIQVCLKTTDILVNTTSVGMFPMVDETLVPQAGFHPGLTVIDIVYNPLKTRLLREAEQQGARIISGLEMLVWQGAAAFEIWSGCKAPVEEMRQAAAGALKTNED